MSRPWRIRYAGAKYHVTVRGNGRQAVFHDDNYYQRFIEQLNDALENDQVILYAFALLPNHYHLFVETPHGNIQRFMQRLNTAYSMYHRYRRKAPGHCFQGRYGAKLVNGDDYILRLTRYIHLNPVKVAACRDMAFDAKVQHLRDYKWSSYRYYIGEPAGFDLDIDRRWLDLLHATTLKGRMSAYRRYVESFVARTDDEITHALNANRYACGDARFIEQVESDLKEVRVNKGVYGDIRWPDGKQLPLEQIADEVSEGFNLDRKALLTRCEASRIARKVALELSCRYSGKSQRQIGEYYGYRGNGSVLKQRKRLKEIMETDERLRKRFEKISKQLAKK